MKALFQQDLLPRVISGSSVGSIGENSPSCSASLTGQRADSLCHTTANRLWSTVLSIGENCKWNWEKKALQVVEGPITGIFLSVHQNLDPYLFILELTLPVRCAQGSTSSLSKPIHSPWPLLCSCGYNGNPQ